MKVYLDGNIDTPEIDVNTSNTYRDDLVDSVSIGYLDRASPTGAYDGDVDEVAIYDHALGTDRIAAHYLTAVPEPASLALVGLGTLAMLRRRSA